MAPRIDSAKPSIAPKVQSAPAVSKAEAPAAAAPAARATPPSGSGFDLAKKKPVSVSGRYVAHKPVVSDRGDLKGLISGSRLAQQAGNSSPSLSLQLGGPAPEADSAIAKVFAEASGGMMNAASLADETAKIEKLSPGPKGERAKLIAQVKAGKVTDPAVIGALLNTSMPGEQTALLKGLPKKTLEGLKPLMKAGELQQDAAVGLGIELAAQTAWGKKNPKIVDGLRTALKDGNINANLKTGLGSVTDGKMNLKADLLKNPEALATVLAHEGVHMHQGSDCCGGKGSSSIAGETEGNVAGAQVWGEIGDPKNPAEYTAQLNAYAEAYKQSGVAGVQTRVGKMYLENAENKVAERKADTTARKPGDTLADWEAMVKELKSELQKK